jgi:hypothetical protein
MAWGLATVTLKPCDCRSEIRLLSAGANSSGVMMI